MSEDSRTLWIGNLDDKVTEKLLYELFLQTGPIDRLIFPTEGEGEHKRHKGHAYIVFKHTETVEYASQVLDGSCLFSQALTMKARNLPAMFKSTSQTGNNTSLGSKERSDNSTLRTGFNKATTWHGQSDLTPRGRSNFRNRESLSNFSQNTGYNTGYNDYSNQVNTGFWMEEQQTTGNNQVPTYSTCNSSSEEKRQMLQQNLTQEAHRQLQQGVMNMAAQMYGLAQQQTQQQEMGIFSDYSPANWHVTSCDASTYMGYTTDQYNNWYQQ